jgi:hypothetical protein
MDAGRVTRDKLRPPILGKPCETVEVATSTA